MRSYRVGPVAFLASLIFCSSLSAQSDQPFSVQVSGFLHETDPASRWNRGVESQIRWTHGAWSFGAGVQYTIYEETFDGGGTSWDYDASTVGLFLEPKFVFAVFGDRFGLYAFGRVTLARMTENESGIRSLFDEGGQGGQEPYSVMGTVSGPAVTAGPGLLIRLTSRVNLDLGVTAGFAYWGEPDTNLNVFQVGTISTEAQSFFSVGFWVGFAIGIG